MKKILFILSCAFLLSGCASTLTRGELKRLTWKQTTYTAAEWRYMGSKKDYHYFHCSGIVLLEGGVYKISDNDLEIRKPIPYSKESSKWILLPWGSPHPDNRNLAQNITEQSLHPMINELDIDSNDLIVTNLDNSITVYRDQKHTKTNQLLHHTK